MKQLTCEMCGSTELIKQDGFFVCQTCGCKYSVEEAKKMMIEGTVQVSGGVEVKNAAQLENLLNLAQSSFESKNYAQAEEFCNQVIAIDAKNYTAWKLKGEAINYQITSKNPRILEVYNCIMTSYDILDDDDKEEKKFEILSSLKTCFEGEIDFWVKQFEANRPTEAALNKVKSSYVDSYNKMAESFTKLGFNETKQGYLDNFDNYFIEIANEICVSAWKSTVGYNYYRDDFDCLGSNWHFDHRWVNTDTDSYRPMEKTFDTFIAETDNLIALLKYAEEQFNEGTPLSEKEHIFDNIIYFEKRLIEAWSFKIKQGYTSNWDQYKSVGWAYEYSLTDAAKESRRKTIKLYEDKKIKAKKQEEEKLEREKEARIKAYWDAHESEKDALDNEKKNLEDIKEKTTTQIAELQKSKEKVPSLELLVKKQKEIEALEVQKKALGLFKFKEKKALQEQIDSLVVEKGKIKTKVTAEQQEIEKQITPIRAELNKAIARIKEIDNELTMDRDEEKDDDE